jgi:hypothetical protein
MCFFWYQISHSQSILSSDSIDLCEFKQELVSEDGYKRLMASQMISKFEKYWSEFSLVLAIAVVLDPSCAL